MRNTGAKTEVKEQRCNLQMISHTPNGENWRVEAVIKMYYEKLLHPVDWSEIRRALIALSLRL